MKLRTLSLTALFLSATLAMAQTPPPTFPANPTVPVAPPNAASVPPEKIAPPDGELNTRPSQRKTTITPPDFDPAMTVRPPSDTTARTPVIPPPGYLDGKPSIVPK